MSQNPQYKYNTISAATHLKNVNKNIEIMKKRCKVLNQQQDYSRYKSLDIENKIDLHKMIHQKVIAEKQALRRYFQIANNNKTIQLYKKAEEIRNNIKNNLKLAQRRIFKQKLSKQKQINQMKIQQQSLIELNNKRNKRQQIIKKQLIQAQKLQNYYAQKIQKTKTQKECDDEKLQIIASERQKQLQKLLSYQQQLLQIRSKSIQASRVIKNKYDSLFPIASPISTPKVSQISQRKKQVYTNHSKFSNNTQIIII